MTLINTEEAHIKLSPGSMTLINSEEAHIKLSSGSMTQINTEETHIKLSSGSMTLINSEEAHIKLSSGSMTLINTDKAHIKLSSGSTTPINTEETHVKWVLSGACRQKITSPHLDLSSRPGSSLERAEQQIDLNLYCRKYNHDTDKPMWCRDFSAKYSLCILYYKGTLFNPF